MTRTADRMSKGYRETVERTFGRARALAEAHNGEFRGDGLKIYRNGGSLLVYQNDLLVFSADMLKDGFRPGLFTEGVAAQAVDREFDRMQREKARGLRRGSGMKAR
jgi:hypothetical protein